MTHWLYSWLMWLAQPLLRRKLARRNMQEPGYGQWVEERFGHYAQEVSAHPGPTVWIHAVSLGETRAAAVLVKALRQQLPQMRLLLTHGTATGREEGLKILQAGDLQAWQPWDTPAAVKRFLTHFKPDLGILMETEVWPNLVAECRQMAVPLVLVNARLSAKSLRKARRLAWLARPTFAALTAVWAQTLPDAQRLQSLGADVRGIMGNLKFDATPDAGQLALGRAWRSTMDRSVVMFASSREGEELALLQLLSHARQQGEVGQTVVASTARQSMHAESANCHAALSMMDGVQWLIVPRHPQRFDAVAKLIQSRGFAVQRRSSWGPAGPVVQDAAPSVFWLGDSMGEMALYFGLADVALLGGSFEPLGGQNLIEAATCGCPVVMGPHTFNFADAAMQAQAAGAALRVADLNQGASAACEIAQDQSRKQTMRLAGMALAEKNQGAVMRTAQNLVKLLHQQGIDGIEVSSR